ncbi:MAG: hypothetical protein QM652_06050 [Legionella sp.]|uniref:hypothetical protein n=1 Tax=Legionella sp. TaxID=459 RepID=UPI0039E3A7D9
MNKFLTIAFFTAAAFPVMSAQSNYYLLDDEIKIVKLKDFMKPSIKNDKDAQFIKETINEFKKIHDDMITRGYVEEFNSTARDLLTQENIIHFKGSMGLKNKGLKQSISELPIAYEYKTIPSNTYTNHLGFSNMGVYREINQGYEKEGWTGVVELFVKDKLTCLYSEHNTKLAHGGNELIEEFLTYKVHNKPTIELVKGNNSSGYSYKVEWYEKGFDKKLDCANKTYSKDVLNSVISLANDIDLK